MGRKKRPYYRIVVVDSRRKRDGAFIDRIGYYHPIENPAGLMIDGEKALKWLRDGAIPSDTVLSLLKKEGVWLRFRLERRGLPESQIGEMMNAWFVKHQKPIVELKTSVSAPMPAPAPKPEPVEEVAPVVAAAAVVEVAPEVVIETAEVASEAVADASPIVEASATEEVPVIDEAVPNA